MDISAYKDKRRRDKNCAVAVLALLAISFTAFLGVCMVPHGPSMHDNTCGSCYIVLRFLGGVIFACFVGTVGVVATWFHDIPGGWV